MKLCKMPFSETTTLFCEMQVFFPSNNTADTLKLLFLIQNTFLNLVISKKQCQVLFEGKKQ